MISSSQRPLPTRYKTNTKDEHLCPQRDSNPRPQQSSGFRPTFQIARPPRMAFEFIICSLFYHSTLYNLRYWYLFSKQWTYKVKSSKFNPPTQFLYMKLLCFGKWHWSPVTYLRNELCRKLVPRKESWFVSRRCLFCSYKRTHVFSPVTILLGRLILWRLWGFARRQWLGIKFQASIQRFH